MSAAINPHHMTMLDNDNVYELGRRLVKGPRKAVPIPAACVKSTREDLNILQLNIQGLQYKRVELEKMLSDFNVHVALLQETLLPWFNINITGYTQYKCECRGCQGIMTLIRNDVKGKVENKSQGDIDWQTSTIWISSKTKFTIHNMYYPPSSNANLPNMQNIFQKTIIAGDFNAHLPHLGYKNTNHRGLEVEKLWNESNLILLQSKNTKPTFLHRAHGTTSRPDLTLISADLQDSITTEVLDDVGSDHLPFLTKISASNYQYKRKKSRKCRWNFRKTNWNLYKLRTNAELIKISKNQPIDKYYDEVTSVIYSAVKASTPCGNRRKYQPFWTEELNAAIKERRRARKKAEKHPTIENKKSYNKLTAVVRRKTKIAKSQAWRETCSKLDLNKEGHKAWRLLNNLEGKSKKSNPQPLLHKEKEIISDAKKAKIFNKHFANVNRSQKRKTFDNALWKTWKKVSKSNSTLKQFESPFSMQELEHAIKKLKNRKTPGPDKITNEMIKNLGTTSKLVLLDLVNRTWISGNLPTMWRTAVINPILKKGKSPGDPKSYRPISLTSCIGKVAERLVNDRLYWWLEKNKLLNNSQAGFRRGWRTDDQLFRFVQSTIQGFKNQKHTFAVFVDLQQAYDRVWRKGLLIKMKQMGIQGNMFKWIQGFLTNRTISTKYGDTISPKLTLEEGLPQGSSLSCTLFLIFVNDLPQYLNVQNALFADDLVIWTTDKYPIFAKNKLKKALQTITTYCNLWKMKINNNKSVYSIFTRSHKISSKILDLKLENKNLAKENMPVYLGIKLDQRLNMAEHLENTKEKATKRLNLIKRLASTSWGAQKETLRGLYLGYVQSAMDYNISLETIANKSAVEKIDRLQNQALRLICGAMKSTPTAACEIDANICPRDLRRERTLVETVERYRRKEQDHPNRKLVDEWKTIPRLQQKTLLDVEIELAEKQHLPQDRMTENPFSGPAPWEHLCPPTIKTTLLDETVNKDTLPSLLVASALETIDSYQESAIHVYTDGSALKGTKNAGFGVLLKYPDSTKLDYSDSCGSDCSNYEAETIAITTAVQLLHQQFLLSEAIPNNIVIFSDSKSALEALQNPPYETNFILEAAQTIHLLITVYNIEITLQWIPGHCGIEGNEAADRLAKLGSNKTQREKPCSLTTAKQMLRQNAREDWLNRWAGGTTGRAMFKEMPKPDRHDAIKNLGRQDQSLIFQFRTQHSKTNFDLNRFIPTHEPHCRLCNHPYETTSHILFSCPKLKRPREDLLPPAPSVRNTLYGPLGQLKRTSHFIRLALAVEE